MFFNMLSEKCKKVLTIAMAESQALNHAFIGTTHIFIGLCKINDESIRQIFKEFSIDPLIRKELRAKVGVGLGLADANDLKYSSRVFDIFDETQRITQAYYIKEIEPIHLFLGILRGGEGEAVKILIDKSVNINELKAYIENLISSFANQNERTNHDYNTPFLNKIGRDLTFLANKNNLDLVIGRKNEITKISQILTLKKKNNPILVGEAGVGKTAVVEGLASRFIKEDLPKELKGLRIIEVSMASLLAGTKLRGEFEENVLNVIKEASSNSNIILFIDEIHTLVNNGTGDGSLDASDILKPALARGEIRCIGATTNEEYRKYIEMDPALERRFHKIIIEEPTPEVALDIVKQARVSYEKHHGVSISDDAIEASVDLSVRYLRSKKLPDKALDLLDQAASRKKIVKLTILDQKDLITDPIVTYEDIAAVVAELTNIPVGKLSETEKEKLEDLEEVLKNRVIGQDEAIKSIATTIKTARVGLQDQTKPWGVFLFLGSTGVGKTELAKALTEFLFDNEKKLIRLDMSEYMEKHNVTRLIGAPPGYIGHEEDGQLTKAVKQQPYSIILLDEIEKAHPEIYNIFLQVFDDGRLTDSSGTVIDFTNTIIIMTSNITVEAEREKIIGFNKSFEETKVNEKDLRNNQDLQMVLLQTFRPEFLNRIDKIILFNSLSKLSLRKIIDIKIKGIKEILSGKGIILSVNREVFDYLIQYGYSEQNGVREMNRFISRSIIEPLAEKILENNVSRGDLIRLEINSGDLHFVEEKRHHI